MLKYIILSAMINSIPHSMPNGDYYHHVIPEGEFKGMHLTVTINDEEVCASIKHKDGTCWDLDK